MTFASAIIALVLILIIGTLVNRVATAMLVFTGMSRDMARFQARSASSLCGYTTSESESMVNHPVRRRILGTLILMGSVGFVSTTAAVLSGASTVSDGESSPLFRIGVLLAILIALWFLVRSKFLDDLLFRWISSALKRFTHLEVHDYVNLLQLGKDYSVTEIRLAEGDWLTGTRLDELRLGDIGIHVLAIHRADGEFLGVLSGETYLLPGDRIILYGRRSVIEALETQKENPEAGANHMALIQERRIRWRHEAEARGEGFLVMEMVVRPEGWLCNKRLDDLRLGDAGVHVLGIRRAGGDYIGAPVGSTYIRGDDTLVLYGNRPSIEAIEETRGDPDGESKYRGIAKQKRNEFDLRNDMSQAVHLERFMKPTPSKEEPA